MDNLTKENIKFLDDSVQRMKEADILITKQRFDLANIKLAMAILAKENAFLCISAIADIKMDEILKELAILKGEKKMKDNVKSDIKMEIELSAETLKDLAYGRMKTYTYEKDNVRVIVRKIGENYPCEKKDPKQYLKEFMGAYCKKYDWSFVTKDRKIVTAYNCEDCEFKDGSFCTLKNDFGVGISSSENAMIQFDTMTAYPRTSGKVVRDNEKAQEALSHFFDCHCKEISCDECPIYKNDKRSSSLFLFPTMCPVTGQIQKLRELL